MATRLGSHARTPDGRSRVAIGQGAPRTAALRLRRRDPARGGRGRRLSDRRNSTPRRPRTIPPRCVRELDEGGTPTFVIEESAAASISDLTTPSGIVAVAPMRSCGVDELFRAREPDSRARRRQRSGQRGHPPALGRRLRLRGRGLRAAWRRSVPSQGRPRLDGCGFSARADRR